MAVRTSIGGFGVHKRQNQGQPLPGRVTGFTGLTGQWMVGGLVARAVTSAGHTIGDNGLIVRKRQYQWQPGRYRVAGLAIFQCSRMVGPFTGHSTGQTVMTAGGGTRLPCHSAVIKTHLPPVGNAGVATVACVIGRHMISAFAAGNDVIVTSGARITGLIVSERQYKIVPTRPSGMAAFTSVRGFGMRRGFGRGVCSVMTRNTRVRGLIVGKRRDQRQPSDGCMARFATLSSIWMRCNFSCSLTGTVMATGTVAILAGHFGVIEKGHDPVCHRMALATI